MSIVYAGLWDDDSIFAQFVADKSDQFDPKTVLELAVNVFSRIDRTYDHRKPFSPYQGFVFSYLVERERAFLCATTEGLPSRTAFSFLDRVKDEYFNGYEGSKRKSDYAKFLKQQAEFFSDPQADKIRALKAKTDETIVQMTANYEQMMNRGRALDDLEAGSQLLRDEAEELEKNAKKLKCKLCRDNLKATVCLAITGTVTCLVIIGVIILVLWLLKPGDIIITSQSTRTSSTAASTTTIPTTTVTTTTTTAAPTTTTTTVTTTIATTVTSS